MKSSKIEIVNKLAKKFVEYNNTKQSPTITNNNTKTVKSVLNNTDNDINNKYNEKINKDINNGLFKTFSRPNVSYDWNKETHEIMLHFGKNGKGLTDEFIVIGEFVKRLSEKAYIFITDTYIDTLDDVYDIKLHYIYK